MKRYFWASLLIATTNFLANGQSIRDVLNPTLTNPAIANYNNQNVLLNTTEISNGLDFFPITNNLAYFTEFSKVNASFSNYAYSSQYLSSWGQNFSFSKGLNLGKGNLNIGLGGIVGNTSINDSIAVPFKYETRLGYSLNFGVKLSNWVPPNRTRI